MKTKYYSSDHILGEFEKFSKVKMIDVLYDALDYMQEYNGRTKLLCIAMAMSYDNIEGEGDTFIKMD